MKCNHAYGAAWEENTLVTAESYDYYSNVLMEKFTYCPYCKVQVHTIDGVPLDLPVDYPEDDCIRGGCED